MDREGRPQRNPPEGVQGEKQASPGPCAAVTLERHHPHTGGDAVPRARHACKARFVCAHPRADVSSCPFPIFLNILNEWFYLFENAKKPDPFKKVKKALHRSNPDFGVLKWGEPSVWL